MFYASYLQTYIDRDVKEHVQLADPLLFLDFVRAAACRAGLCMRPKLSAINSKNFIVPIWMI